MPSLLDIDSFMKSQGTQTNGLGTIPSYKGEDINSLIDEISLTEGVDPELIRAVVKLESGFNPNAKAPTSSASGLMQLVKGTANEMGVQDVFDPRQNLTGGIRYLKKHLDATGGDVDKALRMYNQGPAGDLSKAQGYVDTVKRFYGKDFSQATSQESPSQSLDMGDIVAKYGVDPYPKKDPSNFTLPNIPQEQPDATDIAKGIDESAIGRGFTQALNGPQPEVGKLPFGVENKGGTISQLSKDILYGLPEGVMNLGAGILGLPAAAIGSVSKLATGSSLEEAGDTFNEIAHTAMGTPQTATAQYMMKPFEVVFGGILNSGAEVVKDLNPTATPEELDSKIKATQYVMNLAMVAPMFKGAIRGRGKVDAKNPAKSLQSQEITPEVVESAKAQVLNDPQVAPEIKAQVENITPDFLQTIKQKASESIAKDRVQKAGVPTAKFEGNQSIVEGLLTEVELREGRAKTTMRKAAKIVAEMDGDVALADLKSIKGINPEGSTGKAIARLIEERDASKKIEDIPTTGEDIPIEPVKSLEDIPSKVETPSEVLPSESVPDVNHLQTLAESVDPDLRYIKSQEGIPGVIDDAHQFSVKIPGSDKETGVTVLGEVTPEKVKEATDKILEKYAPKVEEPVVEPKVESVKSYKSTPEFIVDNTNSPVTFYHGTNIDVGKLDPYQTKYGLFGEGLYFTDSPDIASSYTKKERGSNPQVHPVHLKIKNPIDMDAIGDKYAWEKVFPDIDFTDIKEGKSNEDYYRWVEKDLSQQNIPVYEGSEIMQDGIKSMGYDGVTHIGGGRVGDGPKHRVYVAFEPEQIVPKFKPKEEEVILDGQEGQGQRQGREGLLTIEEPLPISEFDNINLAIDEGYSFPLKKRFSKLEDAQAKAQSLGEGHEVVKIGDKYRVGKFEETPSLKEYPDEAALNRDGWELMSEIPSNKVKFESPSEGFGLAKVGDKYYRISKYVEMPEREVKSDLIPKDKWEDGVSPEDWAALKAFTDEATYNEIVAQDKLKELASALPDDTITPEEYINLYRGEPTINERPTPRSTEGAFFYSEQDKDKSKGYTVSMINPDLKGAVRTLKVPKSIIDKLADFNNEELYSRITSPEDYSPVYNRGVNPMESTNQSLRDNGYVGFKVQRPGDDLNPGKIEFYLLPEAYKDLKFEPIVNENAALAKAFLEWRDSYVTKCNVGKSPQKSKPITKESLAIVDDNFKTFDSIEAANEWMEATGAVGELIPDPLTGKVSFMNTEKLKGLDELDAWDEGVEQLTGRRENYSDGMLSSDDLYNVQGSTPNLWGYPFKGDGSFKTGREFYREVYPVYRLGGEKTSGVKTIGEALDILIKHSDDSVEKRIAEKIYSAIDKDIPIKFESNGLGKLGLRGKDILGMYSQWESGNPKGFIALATEDSSILSYTPSIGTLARTIVHESTHAVLSSALRKGMDERETSTYSNEAIFAAKIDRAYIKAKEVLKDKYPKEYGLSSRNEFLAEALSNNKFQDLLKEVKMYNGTIWGKLVESIREFLGFSKEESNAFFKVLDATDRYIDTIKPEMELSDTGKMDLFSILNNDRGSVDITSLRSTVDLIQDTIKAAQKMGKSIDEYLMHIGADEVAIEAFKSALSQVPQMKQQLREQDPVTSSILMPEGKVVAQTINRNRNKQVVSVGPPITEALASKVMNADRTKQWGSDTIFKDPKTGKVQVHHTSNMFERFMEATETKINAFRSAGLQDVYSMWREAKSAAEKEKVQIKEWLDDLEKQIAPERREAFALNAYKDMKSVKEAFDAMGISEIPELTLQESKVLEQLLDYTRKFRDRSNYIRTHTGQKAIPQLKDMKGRENYLPLIRDINVLRNMGLTEGLTISDSKKLGELSKKFNGMFNPNSKKRNVSDIPIELDPFKALKRHAEYGLDEIHISPVAALAKDLANLKLPRVDGVKGKISLADWNPSLSRMLSRWSDQIVGKDIVGTAMANANPFFSKVTQGLSRNLVVATIGGSLRTILVQPTSYAIGIPTMLDMRSTAYGLFKLASERPFGKSNARENSSILAIREAEYAYKELADYIQQRKMSGIRAYVADKSLAPMKWVDSIIAEASWNAARYYGEKTLKLQGKELYRFADDIVERTQGMGLKGAVADVQSSAATKWLTLLQTFGISDFNLIARDVLGIKNPEANQTKTIIRVAKYTAATIMTGQLYKMIGLDNVVPDPIGTYEEAKKNGKGDLHAIGMAAAELLEKVPIIGGSAKYGSSLGGIAGEWAEIVPDAAAKLGESLDWKKLTPKQRSYNIRLMARAAGYTLGIPYTNQILKSINSAYKGGNPWEVILGVYEKERGKKSGSLRPEIPRPPRPSISF